MKYLHGPLLAALMAMPAALTAEPATSRLVEPSVDRIMGRVCEQLRSAPAFSVAAEINYDDVLLSGLKVQYQRRNEILLDRPDRLRIDSESDKGRRNILYNGSSITVFDPDLNVYVQVPAPDTIDATLDRVVDYGIALPLEDLMSSEPCTWLEGEGLQGYYGGRHYLYGDYLHHLLFRVEAADFQLWVEGGDVPVIQRVIIEYREREGSPRYEARFSDWNFRPAIDAAVFGFAPPEGANRIEFRAARSTGEGDRP